MSQNAKLEVCLKQAFPKTESRIAISKCVTLVVAAVSLTLIGTLPIAAQSSSSTAHDPGVRTGSIGAGAPIAGLTPNQQAFFSAGLMTFNEIDSVKGTVAGTGLGLGPRFNAESCAQCHAAPAPGGSSPSVNPQVAAAIDQGAANQIPAFITTNGPVREARFPLTTDLRHPDGGVHALFTIAGRSDAPGCSLKQPNFQQALDSNNVIFRIPTPVYGGGLIESIPDSAILAQVNDQSDQKHRMGIGGRPNTNLGAGISGSRQHQRKRRYRHAFRLEGAEQVARNLFWRSLQRRDGRDEQPVSKRTRRDRRMRVQRHSRGQHELRPERHFVAQ